jgi:hypothetical protein
MTRNVTLRLDERLLTDLRHRAVDQHMSLSAWVVRALQEIVATDVARERVRRRALDHLAQGLNLGGSPLSREETHAR